VHGGYPQAYARRLADAKKQASFTNAAAGGTTIRAVHITELQVPGSQWPQGIETCRSIRRAMRRKAWSGPGIAWPQVTYPLGHLTLARSAVISDRNPSLTRIVADGYAGIS
jgi:hypothetical protein